VKKANTSKSYNELMTDMENISRSMRKLDVATSNLREDRLLLEFSSVKKFIKSSEADMTDLKLKYEALKRLLDDQEGLKGMLSAGLRKATENLLNDLKPMLKTGTKVIEGDHIFEMINNPFDRERKTQSVGVKIVLENGENKADLNIFSFIDGKKQLFATLTVGLK
jgi:hypothetical protein